MTGPLAGLAGAVGVSAVRSDPDRLAFEIDAPRRQPPAPGGCDAARAGRDAGVHPAGHPGSGAHARRRRRRRARLRAGPRQHLPPVPRARATSGSPSSAACTGSWAGIGAIDHRLRRLPGLLARARQRRRRDQGPRAAGRAAAAGCSRSPSGACAFAPTSTARSGSWARRSRWRSRPRSAPTSRSSSTSARPSTPTATTRPARPSAPTAGSTAASPGTPSTGPASQAVFGIVQGGVHEDLRRESAERGRARPAVDGLAIGGTLGRDKPEMHGVLDDDGAAAAGRGAQAPARDRRARRPARRDRRSGSTSSTAPCRPGSPATGWRWRRCPDSRFRFDVAKPAYALDEGPLVEGCPCPTCAAPHARLPALPRPRRGADRRAAADAPQPDVPRAPRRAARGPRSPPAAYERYRAAVLGGAAPWEPRRLERSLARAYCVFSLMKSSIDWI